jgi:hypothetical protein
MARGWESNSAEEEADRRMEQRKEAQGQSKATVSDAEAARIRLRQMLELKRERILSEKTSQPARRQALLVALAEIEEQIRALGDANF